MTGHTPDETGRLLIWPSGVGGGQCEDCDEWTVVRWFGDWDDHGRFLCRECVEGTGDDDWQADD